MITTVLKTFPARIAQALDALAEASFRRADTQGPKDDTAAGEFMTAYIVAQGEAQRRISRRPLGR